MAKKEKDTTLTREKNNAQAAFMQKVKDALPPNISIVEELVDLLGISQDSAYRRLRGETFLSIEEITLICSRYKISFDTFIQSSQNETVNFIYRSLKNSQDSYHDYLKRILTDLKKLSSYPNSEIVYAAVDIPIFHHFNFPELAAFKIFYWCRSILNVPELQQAKFSPGAINREVADTARQVYEEYCKIRSIEIWAEETANSTLRQIEFSWDSGAFAGKEDALKVCEQVKQMFENIKVMASQHSKVPAEKRSKEFEENYTLYSSEVT